MQARDCILRAREGTDFARKIWAWNTRRGTLFTPRERDGGKKGRFSTGKCS